MGERECCRGSGGRSYRSSRSNSHGSLVSSLYGHSVGGRLLRKVGFGYLLLLLWLNLLLLSCLSKSLLLLLLLLLLLTKRKVGNIFPLWKLRLDSNCSSSAV